MQFSALFPGQGSQKIGMGKSFYENFSLAKEMIEEASDRLHIDFKNLLFEKNELLNKTEYTQPAILIVSLIAYRLFNQKPLFFLGHSLGEFSALVASGALDFGDGVELVHKRGEFMQEAAKGKDGGMMAVLGLEDEVVEKMCEEARKEGLQVWPANYNAPGQIVLAGLKSDLEVIAPKLKSAGAKRALLLNMNVASHCPLMENARKPLREYLEKFIKDSFTAPIISNVTAAPYATKKEAVELLDRQLIEPVRYKQSIESIAGQNELFIEFGEGGVLKGLNRRITKIPTINICDVKSLEEAVDNYK